jgi:hypothetical protein
LEEAGQQVLERAKHGVRFWHWANTPLKGG